MHKAEADEKAKKFVHCLHFFVNSVVRLNHRSQSAVESLFRVFVRATHTGHLLRDVAKLFREVQHDGDQEDVHRVQTV